MQYIFLKSINIGPLISHFFKITNHRSLFFLKISIYIKIIIRLVSIHPLSICIIDLPTTANSYQEPCGHQTVNYGYYGGYQTISYWTPRILPDNQLFDTVHSTRPSTTGHHSFYQTISYRTSCILPDNQLLDTMHSTRQSATGHYIFYQCADKPCILSWPMVISGSVNEFFVAV